MTLHILRIRESAIRRGLHEWLIEGDDPQGHLVQVQTLDQWKAAVCERAKATGQPVTIGYKETRYGKTIRQVTLNEPTDWSAA